MSYQHGVYTSEIPTSILPAVQSGTVPVVFGSAPVHMSRREKVPVHEPILCHTYQEAVEAFGYSDDWRFTLCEFMYSYFGTYQSSPAILINVLDPDTMRTSEANVPATLQNDIAVVKQSGIVLASVVVKSDDGAVTYAEGTDYSVDFDKEGHLIVQRIVGGSMTAGEALSLDFDKLDPSAVTADDLIGGIDGEGKPTGLELLNQVFPKYRIVPGMVLAPGFSHHADVAAVMTAKAGNINGSFKCLALTDIPSDIVTSYSDVPEWKNLNSYTSERQINSWPKLSLGGRSYHMSTQLAGVMAVTDAGNGNVPYVSPSNQSLQADGAQLADGTEVLLGQDQANYLNGEGIVTALNWIGGWRAWGNRTGVYPANTDPKDAFIPVRRMMDWIQNTIILTFWQQVDAPITRRLVEAVTDSLNLWLNGLAAAGNILGGRVEFLASENPDAALADGIVKFHVYVTPPSPAKEIDFVVEYDPQYLSGLFA
ncbi:phage tail sheath family protein [Xylanibacillus composti]|uniref:Phage tail sheath family protein n=1 Tax=Xylanibacillus composti TaxID=1572762 RepID=A0A8J4H1L4_9BACL|nr:phage tail sheath family protein [Xylanibacillus composti]MDT9724273.1 phage tail sheath family protein [Xylanibacillus composti]GIQ69268.1 hypothetical protein XYCOK13_20920 [Xylanibacillus composti]